MWTGAAISAGGSILGGLLGGSGANKAQKAQAEATRDAILLQQQQQAQNRADLAPWRDTGSAAINRLGVLMGLTAGGTTGTTRKLVPLTQANFTPAGYLEANPDIAASQWASDPLEHFTKWGSSEGRSIYVDEPNPVVAGNEPEGYGDLLKKFTTQDFYDDPVQQLSFQYGAELGERGISNMARATGMLNTGGTLKALTRFGQDYAGSKAADSYNRFVNDQTTLYNRLAGIAGTGQTAATNTAQFGANTANNMSNMLTAQGNARGASQIAGGNAWGGAVQSAGNTIGNMVNSYNQNQNAWSPTYALNQNSTQNTGGMGYW